MKLSYYVAPCLDDSPVYSIRAKTKKEVQEKLKGDWNKSSYGPIKKVELEYRDGFDLMMECMGHEGRGWWE